MGFGLILANPENGKISISLLSSRFYLPYRDKLIEAIRNGSAATWKYFNLHGEFDFSDERMVDSMGLGFPKNSGLKLG